MVSHAFELPPHEQTMLRRRRDGRLPDGALPPGDFVLTGIQTGFNYVLWIQLHCHATTTALTCTHPQPTLSSENMQHILMLLAACLAAVSQVRSGAHVDATSNACQL